MPANIYLCLLGTLSAKPLSFRQDLDPNRLARFANTTAKESGLAVILAPRRLRNSGSTRGRQIK